MLQRSMNYIMKNKISLGWIFLWALPYNLSQHDIEPSYLFKYSARFTSMLQKYIPIVCLNRSQLKL